MKTVSLFSLIFGLAIILCSCGFLQVSPDTEGMAVEAVGLVAFNAGCVGVIEMPKIIDPAATIAKNIVDLIDDGVTELKALVTDLTAVLNVDLENKVLQANIERMLGNIKVVLSPDVDPEQIASMKIILQSFVDGVEKCRSD